MTDNDYYIDIEVDSSIDGSVGNSIVESSSIETIVVDSVPLVAESSIIETIVVDSATLVAESQIESQIESELNRLCDNDDHISMWLEEQGVRGDEDNQGLQDRRYPLRRRRPTAKAVGLG